MRNPIARMLFGLLLSILLALHPSGALAGEEGSPDIAAELSRIVNQARNQEPVDTISEGRLKAADPNHVLALLAPYEKDPEPFVRDLAYRYGVRLAATHPVPHIREEVTKRLVEASITHSWGQAGTQLMYFTARDFNNQTKALIRQMMAEDPHRVSSVGIKLCGVANIQDQLPRLKELLIDEMEYQAQADKMGDKKWYYTTGWQARLARARMGVKEDIEKCIQLVKQTEESVDRKVTVLLPQIAYIRQPQALECLKEYFLSDEQLAPTNAGAAEEPLSKYLMSELADCLTNFPIKKRASRGYKASEIELARTWMMQQKEWKIRR